MNDARQLMALVMSPPINGPAADAQSGRSTDDAEGLGARFEITENDRE